MTWWRRWASSATGTTSSIAAHDGRVYRWRVEADRTLEMGCRMAGRSLTREEWQEYLPEQPFQDVCPTS